jgi:hypothetical protein
MRTKIALLSALEVHPKCSTWKKKIGNIAKQSEKQEQKKECESACFFSSLVFVRFVRFNRYFSLNFFRFSFIVRIMENFQGVTKFGERDLSRNRKQRKQAQHVEK